MGQFRTWNRGHVVLERIKMKFARIARSPLYPILAGILPVLYYFALNRHGLEWFEIVRPLLVAVLVAAATMGVSFLIARQRDVAMLLSLLLLVVVFLFPIFHGLISVWISPEVDIRYVLLSWCVLGAIAYFFAFWKLRKLKNLERHNSNLNLFAATLCGVQLVIMAAWVVTRPAPDFSSDGRHARWANDKVKQVAELSTVGAARREYPDFYMLILDCYARADVLKTRFDFDNSKFIEELRGAGFFVADRSHSNYPWTHLSMSATLNCDYLHDILPKDFADAAPQGVRQRSIYFTSRIGKEFVQSNRIRQFLELQGYTWHTTHTGYVTEKREASISSVFFGPITAFEDMLLQRTIFVPIAGQTTWHTYWRSQLNAFGDLSERKSPKFVLSHIISPHRPFCFDENGGELTRHPIYDASGFAEDLRAIPGYDQYYRENYPKNVAGLNIHAIQCIKNLLSKTRGEAIIVVQADHGSGLGWYPDDLTKTDIPERFGILNAIYIPEKYSRADLDDSISSVNTFRVVLSSVFGVDLDKLDNRAWSSTGDLEFTEVTNDLRPVQDSLDLENNRPTQAKP